MTYPEDPSQQPQQPQQPGFPPPPQGGPAYPPPPPQGGPAYPPPPPQGGPAYPPPPPQGGPAYPPPPQGGSSYPPAPPPQGAPAYPPAGAPAYGYYGQGGGVPPGMFFDPQSELTLPAGTQLAGVGRRIGAYFLSLLLFIVTIGIGWIIWGLIAWSRGQGPAMQLLGLRAWRPATQQTASWGYMALREIIGRIVEGLFAGIVGLISFIMMLAGKQRKTIHDMIAGTVVLHDPNKVLGS